MTATKLKPKWGLAFAIAFLTHAGGFLIFNLTEPSIDPVDKPNFHLQWVDLENPENIIALEMALMKDPALFFQPPVLISEELRPYSLDDFLLEQSAGEISPRLSLVARSPSTTPVTEGRSELRIVRPLSGRTSSVLRPLGEIDRPMEIRQEQRITASLRFSMDPTIADKKIALKAPEMISTDQIWRPLQLSLWVDTTGSIPFPLIDESTGDEERDLLLIQLFLDELMRKKIRPGHYTVFIGF